MKAAKPKKNSVAIKPTTYQNPHAITIGKSKAAAVIFKALTLLILLLTAPIITAHAQTTVVELFTTSACAACDPADAIIQSLTTDQAKDTIILTCHVAFMGNATTNDDIPLKACDKRHTMYYRAKILQRPSTPIAVINGIHEITATKDHMMRSGLAMAQSTTQVKTLNITRTSNHIQTTLPDITLKNPADIVLITYAPNETTLTKSSGKEKTYTHLVKDVQHIQTWDGLNQDLKIDLNPAHPENTYALIAQKKNGTILAAGKFD